MQTENEKTSSEVLLYQHLIPDCLSVKMSKSLSFIKSFVIYIDYAHLGCLLN